jgi:heavy metal sensor kinase
MRSLAVRWKLTLWYGVVLAVVLTAFSAAVYGMMRHQLLGRIDQGLREELGDVRSEVRRATHPAGLVQWLERRFARHEGFDFQITRPDGSRFFVSNRLTDRSLPAPASASDLSRPMFESVALGDAGRWRVVSMQEHGPDGPLTVQIGRSLAEYEHESGELLAVFLATGPLTVLATLAGGYFLARRALAPVRRMTDTARQISADRLGRRIAVDNPGDELGRLAATLNDMLDRLERSFAEMQRFTADAAHELRTPLAVIRNEAEVALRQPRSADEYGRVLENLLEETVRLGRTADELLFLARQDAGLNPAVRDDVAFDGLLRDVVENMQLVAQEKGVLLALVANPACRVRGDDNQLRRVFYNLIDNAIKFTGPGGAVTVAGRADGATVSVAVADTGVGIPAEHLPRIFDRFYRADPARAGEAGGAGLGLSICRAVVEGAGGTITATSLAGAGAEFVVRLPLAPALPR